MPISKFSNNPNKAVDIATLAISAGEPAGIGPDILVRIAQKPQHNRLLVFADPKMLMQRARDLGFPLRLHECTEKVIPARMPPGELNVVPIPLRRRSEPGKLDPANARAVLKALDKAALSCRSGQCDALVTAPLHKGVINEAGLSFSGHTEYLSNLTGAALPVMLLVAGTLRVALVTTHLPLKSVPHAITADRLSTTIQVLDQGLRDDFSISHPEILVLGLNPHAGEGGHLGDEEMRIISPVIKSLRQEGVSLHGPVPADTAFLSPQGQSADAVLAMYHDQGLPVIKYVGFGRTVNVTLGLPIVRTSVDHGTALNLAGTGQAQEGSLEEAIKLAALIASRRHASNSPS